MNQAEALYHLQEIELGILRARKRLQEIAAALANSETVQTAQSQVNTARKTLTPLQTKARDLDLEIQSTLQKARATEQHLYSGQVKNPKEMQDMQQEIQSLNKRHGELENHLLEMMVAAEEAEAALHDAESVLKGVTAEWESQHQELLDEKKLLEQQAAQLLQQRKTALAQVEPGSKKIYEVLKPKKNYHAVAVLNGSSCSMCGVDQTMAIEREVRQGQKLVYCENCGRILVYRS
jgi:uncharacterized protein